jgi:type I restriction enzyme S subunit
MNLEQLINQFELVTDTEEGLEQLRKVILNQAVSGNLTKQDPNDELVERLLERIDAEKHELYEEGDIRKPKDIPEVEYPEFKLPINWKWCRLGVLMTYTNGYAFKSSKFTDKGVGVVKIGDLQNGSVTESKMNYISPDIKEDIGDKYDVLPGDLMIAMSGATTGKLAFNNSNKTYLLNQRVGIIRPYFVSKQYLYHYLNTKIEENLNKSSGSAIPNLSTKQIKETKFPLPPLEEQQRIVRNIETLFTQVDELEQKVQQDRTVDERLQVAVLDDLQSAQTPEASKQSWQRLTQNFEQIYRKPEHIDRLKQAILNEAVRGRLVPQDPNDEPAEKLLQRIKEEKQRLYDEGEIRKPKELPEISEQEIPYTLPNNWTWCRMGTITKILAGHSFKSNSFTDEPGVRCIKITNAGVNEFLQTEDYLPSDFIWDYKRFQVYEGDLIIALTRPYISNGLKISICPKSYDGALLNQRVAAIKSWINIENQYVYKFLSTNFVLDNFKERFEGKGLQPNLRMRDLTHLLFPLPPVEEQIRIVNKIAELFTWCDNLKETLSRSRQTDRRLLEALVSGMG